MSDVSDTAEQRRPIKSREVIVFQLMARWMARRGVSPDAISLMSIVFGLGAGSALAATARTEGWLTHGCWLAAAALIQLRLLANMLDGMVAMDTKRESPVGELFNEAPDRVSDTFILVGAGFAIGGEVWLGFLAAIVALFVAYVRALGASTGAGQAFHGPMAKPHRMFVLTLIGLYLGVTPMTWHPVHDASGWGLVAGTLIVIILGGLVTAWRRLGFIAKTLRSHAA